jgi:hypothetical protein
VHGEGGVDREGEGVNDWGQLTRAGPGGVMDDTWVMVRRAGKERSFLCAMVSWSKHVLSA